MQIFKQKKELTAYLESIYAPEITFGFVPTMGALHQGHLSLVATSISQNTYTIISIFVNPTQFNNPDDLLKYPRTLENDVEKIKSISENVIVFAPTANDVYDDQITSSHFDFGGLENKMEGKFRSGHFDGVGTVVKKLFEIVKPSNAYFGEKDFQQLKIVKKMVEILKIPVNIIACPISRESSGLAMSSRNNRLSDSEKTEAALIYKTLIQAKDLFSKSSLNVVHSFVENAFNQSKIIQIEYFEIAEEETLETCISKNENLNYRAFVAVFINKIRLIDTISLN